MNFLRDNRRISLNYDGKDVFLLPHTVNTSEKDGTLITEYVFDDGLKITNEAKKIDGFSAYEWVNFIENTSDKNSGVISFLWDAGWCGHDTDITQDEYTGDWSEKVGDWVISPIIHPNGLVDVAETIHNSGYKYILWFEPERARVGTPITKEHPECCISNGGNSGGGLYNASGKIIGIVNAKIVDASVDNISYAIPSNVAKYVADNVIYYDNQNSSNDAVYRALIGVNVDVKSAGVNYDTETGKILKYEEVIVSSVNEGSASQGKLMVGDVINSVTIDGVDYQIKRTFNVIDVMLTARQNSSVVFHVERDGNTIDVEIDMSTITLTKS